MNKRKKREKANSDYEKYQDRLRGWLDVYDSFILNAHRLANEDRWSEIDSLSRP